MTRPVLIALADDDPLADALAARLGAERGRLEARRFPDGERYLRYHADPAGRAVVLLARLDRPDETVLPLLFAAHAARDLGAARIGLVAPYLAYMRQDRRFRPGEAVTSAAFGGILSAQIDWLVTVDPHLHRHADLSAVYRVPAHALQAAPLIARWVAANVERPLLVGPDSESAQWVEPVASAVGAPFLVLDKQRHSDRDVEVSVPAIDRWRDRTPVVLDDIVSSGRTMIETIRHLVGAGAPPPVCVAIHGLFAEGCDRALRDAGARLVVSTNTVSHPAAAIDVTDLLAAGVRDALAR